MAVGTCMCMSTSSYRPSSTMSSRSCCGIWRGNAARRTRSWRPTANRAGCSPSCVRAVAADGPGAVADGSLPVFLTNAPPDGERALLDGEEGRHAANVRRMRQGERLLLTDGAGELAECVIETVRTGRDAEVGLLVQKRWTRPSPSLRVTVVQALIKGERGELAVELATEAGADAIVPWRAARSIARWDDGPRGTKALQRWRRTAQAAAKQSRRAWVPEVREPVDIDNLARLVPAA